MAAKKKQPAKKETAVQKRKRIAAAKAARLKRTAEQKIEICSRISSGETLRDICRSPGMPYWNTVYNWIAADEDFSGRFARAREVGFDAIAQDCLSIADDGRNDYMERSGQDGEVSQRVDSEHIQRSKLRIDTRLKLLAKWSPKKYGEKIDVTSDGKPIRNDWHVHPVTTKRADETD